MWNNESVKIRMIYEKNMYLFHVEQIIVKKSGCAWKLIRKMFHVEQSAGNNKLY